MGLNDLSETIPVSGLSTEVLKDLQDALKQLGYYDGQVDGIYGSKTAKAWANFKQDKYLSDPQLIGKGSAQLLINETASKQHDFSTKQGTIKAIIWECNRLGLTLKSQHAYVIATVEHETAGSFKPVEEGYYLGAKAKTFQRSLRYYPYYGRGYVQLTWKYNYAKYSKLLGIDLVGNPNLACDPNVALFILVHGFKTGAFTGKSLERYVNNGLTDFIGARRCINGTDRAGYIAQIANGWLAKL